MHEKADRNYVATFIICSVGYILLGLLLIFAPERSQQLICTLLGGVSVVLGIMRVLFHFAKKDMSRAFRSDIPIGAVLLIVGIYLIVRWNVVWDWLPVLLGFAIVFDSILKLQHSFDLKISNFRLWWVSMAVALVTAVLGILLILGIFTGITLIYFFGAALVADGIVNIITIILVLLQMRRLDKAKPQDTSSPANSTPEGSATPAPDEDAK